MMDDLAKRAGKAAIKTTAFDPAEYLDTDEAIAAYLSDALAASEARIAELEARLARIAGPAAEVLRISDRDHPAWNELRAALGEKKE